MRIPEYGAAALVKTFLWLRFISLFGMAANFLTTISSIMTMSKMNFYPPSAISGTLAIVRYLPFLLHRYPLTTAQSCMATFYCLLSLPFFYAGANIGLFVLAVFDILCLLSFVIVSSVMGQTLAGLDCVTLVASDDATNTTSAVVLAQQFASEHNMAISFPRLLTWASSTDMNCLWTKYIWATVMILAICFAGTSAILPALWFKSRRLCDVAPEVMHADDKHADAHAH